MDIKLYYETAFICGVASHLGFFSRGEHHMYPVRYFLTFVSALIIGPFILSARADLSLPLALWYVSTLLLTYLLGITASIVPYRLFFHPLRRFPGKFWHRLSDVSLSFELSGLDAHEFITGLHRQKGHAVRIGTNTLSVTHPDAPQAIYGQHSRCAKDSWYDLSLPVISMHSSRERAFHDRRRRVWSPAFSDKAVRGYEQRIHKYQETLLRQIDAEGAGGKAVNWTKWTSMLGWDFMGDMAFGHSFGMLDEGVPHWMVTMQREAFKSEGFRVPIWVFRFAMAIPGIMGGFWKMFNYSRSLLVKRIESRPDIPDVMSSLLKPYADQSPSESDMLLLHGEANLIIVAGSETTATTLSFLMHHLAADPREASLIRSEIQSVLPADGSIPLNQDLQYLPRLNAAINETLRLYPPVPAHVRRLTPPEGLWIGESTDPASIFVPGGTTVISPQWALARDEEVYVRPEEWLPDRWIEEAGAGDSTGASAEGEQQREKLVLKPQAFAPFSLGPYGCIGRPLALLVLRSTVARMLLAYDPALPGGSSAGDVEPVEGVPTDTMGLNPPAFNIVFRKRGAAAGAAAAAGGA